MINLDTYQLDDEEKTLLEDLSSFHPPDANNTMRKRTLLTDLESNLAVATDLGNKLKVILQKIHDFKNLNPPVRDLLIEIRIAILKGTEKKVDIFSAP